MQQKLLNLEIITPTKIIYQKNIKHIRLPANDGYVGILAGHAPFIYSLQIGEIKVDLKNEVRYFAASSGIVEVLPATVTVLIETAEEANDIDIERAIYARERAFLRLSEKSTDIDKQRAKKALKKADNRLKTSKRVKITLSIP